MDDLRFPFVLRPKSRTRSSVNVSQELRQLIERCRPAFLHGFAHANKRGDFFTGGVQWNSFQRHGCLVIGLRERNGRKYLEGKCWSKRSPSQAARVVRERVHKDKPLGGVILR